MAAGDSISLVKGSEADNYEVEDWGIPAEQLGFTATQSISINNTVNQVEAKNRVGEVVAVILYDKRSEVTVEGIGKPNPEIKLGDDLDLDEMDDHLLTESAKIIVSEVGVELANEDWIKYSVKGNVYELID